MQMILAMGGGDCARQMSEPEHTDLPVTLVASPPPHHWLVLAKVTLADETSSVAH
jgi:hypothetical protein